MFLTREPGELDDMFLSGMPEDMILFGVPFDKAISASDMEMEAQS